MSKATNGQHSPAMKWSGAPAGTKSFAIVMIDTQTPPKTGTLVPGTSTKVHFAYFDIPATTTELPADLPRKFLLGMPVGAKASKTFDTYGWFGPGGGISVYTLSLYALNVDTLGLDMGSATQAATFAAIKKAAIGKPAVFVAAGVNGGVP
jgi:phosphatidylethanolamine-binding protein (PEBP) family uncharacterized protein